MVPAGRLVQIGPIGGQSLPGPMTGKGIPQMQMKPLFAAIAITLGLTGGMALAADEAMLTDARKAEITALLVDQGYEVRSIQIEDGRYEVYAVKDGKTFELYLNDALELVEGGED